MNDGLKGYPQGGKIFFPEPERLIGLGGALNTGNEAEVMSTIDLDTLKTYGKTLWAGSGTVNSNSLYYAGMTDGVSAVYQVPAGKKFLCIGAYLNPLLEAAGQSVEWGVGSATASPGGAWVTGAPAGIVQSTLGAFVSPAAPSAFLPSLADHYFYLPFFAAFTASRFVVAAAQSNEGASTARRPGSLILYGLELGA